MSDARMDSESGSLRIYDPDAVGKDGYPPEWHAEIKHLVRELAGHRCVRCGHPYRTGQYGNGEWSPCDERCAHGKQATKYIDVEGFRVARWRILTVHHLNGDKADCRWWNLLATCQRCHLSVQSRVDPFVPYPWEHSEWFRIYAAGFYASKYLALDLTREETEARIDELLELGASMDAVERMPL